MALLQVVWNYKIAGAHELGTYNKVGALELRDYLIEGTVVGGLVNVASLLRR